MRGTLTRDSLLLNILELNNKGKRRAQGEGGVSIPGCRSAFLVTRKLLTFFFGLVPCFLKCPNWAFLTCKVFRPRIKTKREMKKRKP